MTLSKRYPAVPQELSDIFLTIPKAALGFSGGVDSSYLLYAAKTCEVDVHAYFVKSQFQPQFELDDAQRIALEINAELKIIPVDILTSDLVKANPADRCYHCKQRIFSVITAQASVDGYTLLMDGSNASDDESDRPGMRALAELQVRSPLREAGLTKNQVRAYSHQAGLFTWDKPDYACLATRVPAGTALDGNTLSKIENAESILAQMGFVNFRLRVIGNAAKLQLPAPQIPFATKRHAELVGALSPWFEDVLLDLKPRR